MYLGVDAWQSPNGFDILGVVLYRLCDGDGRKPNFEAMPLDFVKLSRSHTGEYLAETVQLVVEKCEIQNKICGIVSDNASNNMVMIKELKKLKWPNFKGEAQWIRCFAHVLNLITKAILRPFGPEKSKKVGTDKPDDEFDNISDNETDDGDEDAGKQILLYARGQDLSNSGGEEENPTDIVDDVAKVADGDELDGVDIDDLSEEDEDNQYTSKTCQQTLAKFRSIARKLNKSPNSKSLFVELCEKKNCDKPHNIERDVATRWNSTLVQLNGIVRCHSAIFEWQRDKRYGIARVSHISDTDIKLAKDLVAVLQLFFEITLQVSTGSSARLSHVVVFIDQITEHLSTVISQKEFPPALRNACRAGVKITNKYYTLTDCSPLYRIAKILHPSFKDQYFKVAGWSQEWIDEAIGLTRELWVSKYKPQEDTSARPEVTKAKPQTGFISQLGAALAARANNSPSDPIDNWLAGDIFLDQFNPVNAVEWWLKQKTRGNGYVGLLDMALDILSCPATSVDVERAFSFGRCYVTARRHQLSGVSVSRGMTVAFYSKNGKILPGVLNRFNEGIKDANLLKKKRKVKEILVE
ncbi:hypothetical protein PGT21_050043 [Puccinia graminis f. sp. tritici]|uniref:HAT C-terminal dimerisation domain-containing protein n=1 Tax=Puccinia graminis f. sp. tritici TaxID=56615 RepID=A0A5B0NU54_PUCGR|nr:hypothetical protein PGT21_050043 [Puccinia graminis f. sp. tritici]KAA1093851.1 hypothetical protein PGTUg99_050076 [Puccinia graminis f. sp. tritici]